MLEPHSSYSTDVIFYGVTSSPSYITASLSITHVDRKCRPTYCSLDRPNFSSHRLSYRPLTTGKILPCRRKILIPQIPTPFSHSASQLSPKSPKSSRVDLSVVTDGPPRRLYRSISFLHVTLDLPTLNIARIKSSCHTSDFLTQTHHQNHLHFVTLQLPSSL